MTTITSTWNYTCAICDKVGSFFRRTVKNYQFARQMAANRQVARDLIGLGFHNQKEYEQIVQRMNDKTIEEYNK